MWTAENEQKVSQTLRDIVPHSVAPDKFIGFEDDKLNKSLSNVLLTE